MWRRLSLWRRFCETDTIVLVRNDSSQAAATIDSRSTSAIGTLDVASPDRNKQWRVTPTFQSSYPTTQVDFFTTRHNFLWPPNYFFWTDTVHLIQVHWCCEESDYCFTMYMHISGGWLIALFWRRLGGSSLVTGCATCFLVIGWVTCVEHSIYRHVIGENKNQWHNFPKIKNVQRRDIPPPLCPPLTPNTLSWLRDALIMGMWQFLYCQLNLSIRRLGRFCESFYKVL